MRLVRSVLFAALLAAAATAHSQPATPAAAKAPPVPLLWKVSDADNAVYVLGSFHLLKPDDYPLSKDVDAAFADAERVVFELAPEEMASPALGMKMGQAALRTDGTQLDSELSPDVAAKLQAWIAANGEHLQKGGVQGPMLQLFEPWFVGLMVSLTEMTKMGLDPKLGLDTHLAQKAKQAGKPTAGLETGEQQIAFLDGMGKDEQLQMLAEALDESAEGRAEMEKLHRQWREGDAQGMWQGMATEMKAEYPELYRRINVERNDAWVGKIEQRLKADKDDTLLVVGALHALGSDGVVEKLKARGYTVERICSACR
jgi:uncharacterized protein YbaP (TraB family)